MKKTVESGFEAISKSEDTVRSVIDKFKDQEITQAAMDQIDETKNGLYRAVAQMRDFLQNTSLASEFKKALTGLAFEVKMEVRFKSTEDENGRQTLRPSADVDVTMKDKNPEQRAAPRRTRSSPAFLVAFAPPWRPPTVHASFAPRARQT